MKDYPLNLTRKAVLSVLLYLESKDNNHKLSAQESLRKLSECYNVKLKKVKGIDLKTALKQFLENRQGAQKEISKLYYSL